MSREDLNRTSNYLILTYCQSGAFVQKKKLMINEKLCSSFENQIVNQANKVIVRIPILNFPPCIRDVEIFEAQTVPRCSR